MALRIKKGLPALFTVLLCCGFPPGAAGQEEASAFPNLVPNPGFEEYASFPIGWFYKGEHFREVMKYWSSPTGASPDVFGPRVRVPLSWAEKGFGRQSAHGGVSMAGITLYGCEDGKPHCREYLQIQLFEPLVAGQEYYVEFWASALPGSFQVNNLGAFFSRDEIREKTDLLLSYKPQVNTADIVRTGEGKWVRISGRFTAAGEAGYLILGNFFPDDLTRTALPERASLPFSYYYIDDVLLRKIEPVRTVPMPGDDLSRMEISEGKVIKLKNIFFETDKATLLPRSFTELDKLLQLMRQYPEMVIQINGHTDNRGTEPYNQDLSERRAHAVVDFLTGSGISPQRLRHKGFGSTSPVASNEDEPGRQLNRRVEFVVLGMQKDRLP